MALLSKVATSYHADFHNYEARLNSGIQHRYAHPSETHLFESRQSVNSAADRLA
jgi:hypothetical protein